MKNLANKVVALTGAGSGIGRCLAIDLSQRGCRLALADVNEQGLEETVALLSGSEKVTTYIVDVANRERVYAWADEVVKDHGEVDVLINNAGVAVTASLEEISYEDFDWVFNIVFYGVLYGTKAFLPHLKSRPEANIVNISSVNGFFPFPNNGPYNAAKHAVKGFNQTLIQELKGSNVHVTSVHPGGIKTNIVRNARHVGDMESQREQVKQFDKAAGTTPEKAASTIIQAILNNRKRQLVGTDAVVIDLLVRLFPQGFSDFVALIFEKRERQMKRSAGKAS